MTPLQRVILLGAAAILVFDALGSLAAKALGFDYGALSPGSYLIDAAIAFAAARVAGFKAGVLAATTVALIEATAGWAISWIIGPGRLPGVSVSVIAGIVVWVTATGALAGAAGAGLAKLVRKDRAAA
jgi:hypothetical protein